MKNTTSIKTFIKAFLAVALFSLGFGRAAAHIDPAHKSAQHTLDMIHPLPPTTDH